MFLPKDQLDCFPIRKDIFTKESDINPLDDFDKGIDTRYIYSAHASRNCDALVPMPTKDTFYTLKPQLLSYNNAYISEQFWVFDENKNIVQEALAENYNVHGYAYNEAYSDQDIKPTFWNKLKRKNLEKQLGHDNLLIQYIMQIPNMKAHFHTMSKDFFQDSNTQYKTVPLNAICIFDQFYANPSHFTYDMFPALHYWWNKFNENQKKNLVFPYPKERSDIRGNMDVWNNYIWPILQTLDIQESQLYPIDHGCIYQFNKVLVPVKTRYNDHVIQPALKTIRKYYINDKQTQKFQSYKHIFIDRKPTSDGRLLKNKQDIQPILNKYNITTVYIEDYTYEEKINLLNNASFIMAGAGSTSLFSILANPKTKCLILNTWTDMETKIFFITITTNLYITIIEIPTIKKNDDEKLNNFIINPQKLDQKLSKILKD